MYEVIENGQVLKVEQEGEAIIKTPYGMSKKINLIPDPLGAKVKIMSWDGKPLPLEPVTIALTGQGIQTVTQTCSDGLIEITGLTGVSVTVTATASGMDSAELVVVL